MLLLKLQGLNCLQLKIIRMPKEHILRRPVLNLLRVPSPPPPCRPPGPQVLGLVDDTKQSRFRNPFLTSLLQWQCDPPTPTLQGRPWDAWRGLSVRAGLKSLLPWARGLPHWASVCPSVKGGENQVEIVNRKVFSTSKKNKS